MSPPSGGKGSGQDQQKESVQGRRARQASRRMPMERISQASRKVLMFSAWAASLAIGPITPSPTTMCRKCHRRRGNERLRGGRLPEERAHARRPEFGSRVDSPECFYLEKKK